MYYIYIYNTLEWEWQIYSDSTSPLLEAPVTNLGYCQSTNGGYPVAGSMCEDSYIQPYIFEPGKPGTREMDIWLGGWLQKWGLLVISYSFSLIDLIFLLTSRYNFSNFNILFRIISFGRIFYSYSVYCRLGVYISTVCSSM